MIVYVRIVYISMLIFIIYSAFEYDYKSDKCTNSKGYYFNNECNEKSSKVQK